MCRGSGFRVLSFTYGAWCRGFRTWNIVLSTGSFRAYRVY